MLVSNCVSKIAGLDVFSPCAFSNVRCPGGTVCSFFSGFLFRWADTDVGEGGPGVVGNLHLSWRVATYADQMQWDLLADNCAIPCGCTSYGMNERMERDRVGWHGCNRYPFGSLRGPPFPLMLLLKRVFASPTCPCEGNFPSTPNPPPPQTQGKRAWK